MKNRLRCIIGTLIVCLAMPSALSAIPPNKKPQSPLFACQKADFFGRSGSEACTAPYAGADSSYGRAVRFSSDGKYLLTAYSDGTALLLDAKTWKEICRTNVNAGYISDRGPSISEYEAGGVRAVLFVPGQRNFLAFYNTRESSPFPIPGQPKPALPQEYVVYWDYSGEILRVLSRPEQVSRPSILRPSDVSSSKDRTQWVAAHGWGPKTDSCFLEVRDTNNPGNVSFFPFRKPISPATLEPEGQRVVVGLELSIKSDRAANIVLPGCPGSPVDQSVIDAHSLKNIVILAIVTGKRRRLNVGHVEHIRGIAVTADGTCVSADLAGVVVFWDISTGKVMKRFWAIPANFLSTSADATVLAIGQLWKIQVINSTTRKPLRAFRVLPRPPEEELHNPDDRWIAHFDLSLKGDRIAIIYADGTVEVWPSHDPGHKPDEVILRAED